MSLGAGEPREFANHLLDQFIGDRYKKMARPHMCMFDFSYYPFFLGSVFPFVRCQLSTEVLVADLKQ